MLPGCHSALLAVTLLASCASTTFESTWKAPDVGPLDYTGKKVAAVFVSAQEGTRRVAEDTLAREISERGAQGVAAYTLISLEELKDEKSARAKLQQAGCAGAVMMRVTSTEKEIHATPATWSGARYSSFSHYSGYGWGTVYEPGYLSTDTIVSIETLVYSLEKDKLIWAGISKTFNPSKTASFVEELADAAAAEMKEAGVIRR